MTDEPTVDVDNDNDEPKMYVVDSEEYQKTKKLQSIYEAKKEFRNVWYNKEDNIERLKDTYYTDNHKQGEGMRLYRGHLADILAMYGSELSPIIRDAVDAGLLEQDDLEVELETDQNLLQLTRKKYQIKDDKDGWRTLRCSCLLDVFRTYERVQRKLGLGLDIEEETEPAII
jgi:hypothetical protein